MARLITNSDGTQYLIYGEDEAANNIQVFIGGVTQASEENVDATASEADDISRKLVTHRAKFDKLSERLTFMKKTTRRTTNDKQGSNA